MKKEYIELVKILNKMQPCTASFLSSQMGLSVRTIKNYIYDINTILPRSIQSSRKGYSISYSNVEKIMSFCQNDIPQTSAERLIYISRRLLQNNNDGIDMYDLSDELCVSISTLNLELQKLRSDLMEFDLQLLVKTNQISIFGTERNKRRLLGDILYKESTINFVDLHTLQDKFVDIDIGFISDMLQEVFSVNHYYINDFSLINLTLHIAISLDRIRHDNVSTQENPLPPVRRHEFILARTIAEKLENFFHLHYNPAEIHELALLILSRSTSVDYKTITAADIGKYIDKDCLSLVEQLIQDIHTYCGIDLRSPEFLTRFSLHIQSLLVRSKNNSFSKNPLTQNIKSSCPLIYDVAVTLASTIQKLTGITINDDEIAYLAVHVGSMLEEQKSLSARITAVLYYPSYYDMVQEIVEKIHLIFGQKLLITSVTTNEQLLSASSQADFIVAVLPLTKITAIPVVQITPFLTQTDQAALQKKIESLKKEKERREFNHYLRGLFRPELFERVEGFESQNQCIQYMTDKYVALGYTDASFAEEVFRREALSSTAFGRFAIPHALNMNAYKTAFNVILCDKPLNWGDFSVSIVIMMCFNQNERHVFNKIFEPITMILNEADNLKRLIDVSSYEDFIETFTSLL